MMLNQSSYLSGQSNTAKAGYASRRLKLAAAAVMAVMALSACGQKGPLYLPSTQTNLQAPAVSS